MTKQQIRSENLKKRRQMENRDVLDGKIRRRILSQPFYKSAETVMTYLSYNSEPDTLALVKIMLAEGKTVCAPVCGEGGRMEASRFQSFSELKPSKMGILEPPETRLVPPQQIDLILVPGCGFNSRGHRIGYGRGFYDRFLPKTSAVTCGLFYELLKTDFNEEKTDIPLQFIITEKTVYSFFSVSKGC